MNLKRKPKPKATQKRLQTDPLTLKQQRWLEHYLVSGNSTDAARKAGYKGSDNVMSQVGFQNLRNYEIQKRITARIGDSQVAADEVVGTLASQMRADITDILTPEGHLDIALIRSKELGHLIKRVKTRRYIENAGTESERTVEITEVELHNSQSAATQLSKILGLEKQPETHPNDLKRQQLIAFHQQINLIVINSPERARKLAELLLLPADQFLEAIESPREDDELRRMKPVRRLSATNATPPA